MGSCPSPCCTKTADYEAIPVLAAALVEHGDGQLPIFSGGGIRVPKSIF